MAVAGTASARITTLAVLTAILTARIPAPATMYVAQDKNKGY